MWRTVTHENMDEICHPQGVATLLSTSVPLSFYSLSVWLLSHLRLNASHILRQYLSFNIASLLLLCHCMSPNPSQGQFSCPAWMMPPPPLRAFWCALFLRLLHLQPLFEANWTDGSAIVTFAMFYILLCWFAYWDYPHWSSAVQTTTVQLVDAVSSDVHSPHILLFHIPEHNIMFLLHHKFLWWLAVLILKHAPYSTVYWTFLLMFLQTEWYSVSKPMQRRFIKLTKI